MKQNTSPAPHVYRYEILDSMEMVVALADCVSDAQYAANCHFAKLIFDTRTNRTIPIVPADRNLG